MTHNVLYIEDNPDNMRLVQRALEGRGYHLLKAMRGMDGIAIAAHVRATRPEIKIVYMSGYAPDPEMLLPGTELIKKPFLRADLSRVVRAALDRPRAA